MPAPTPLPADWPYAPKGGVGELKVSERRELPGLGGGWRLHCSEEPAGDALPMSGVFGRGGLVQAGGCVLRPYRRGGFVRHFSRATYHSPARFKREYDVHARLWAAGLPTVEPMGYAYRRRRLGFEGVFLTRKTEGLPWPKAWGGECDTSLAETVVDLIKSISAWGLWAPDLNATNFLLTPDGRIIALDWDRARWTAKRCLLESHLKRLERSLLKLDAPPPLLAAVRALGMGGE